MSAARGNAQAATDGTYTLEGLDPGTYTLLAAATKTNGPDFAENARFATTTLTIGATRRQPQTLICADPCELQEPSPRSQYHRHECRIPQGS